MKRKFLWACVAMALLFVGSVLNAQASTVWEPTASGDTDMQYIGFTQNVIYAIFDDMSDLSNSDPHYIFLSSIHPPEFLPFFGETIKFTQVGDDWAISNVDFPLWDFGVVLKDSNRFQLAMLTPGVGWVGGSDAFALGYGQHLVSWDNGVAILQIDAQPVPIPAAAYLLSAGLLAFVGIRKRNK